MARQERARGAAGRGSAGSHGRLLLLLRGGGAKASALFLGCLCLAHFAGSVSVLAAAAAVESPPAGLAVYRCPVPDSLRADFVALAEAADLDVWGTRHRKPPKKGRRGRGREGGAGKAGKVNSSVPVVVFRGTESARDAVEALTELPCTTQVADLAAHVRKNIKEIDSIEADDTDTYLDHAPADHDNGEEDNDNDDSDSDEAYGARAYLARKRRIWTKAAFFQTFRRYPAVVQYLKQIAANPPDGVDASLYSVGKSIKNRDIWVMRVTSKRGGSQKKQIWINAAQHAREWIALTTALYTLTSLLSSYSAHPAFLDSFEFFFSPLANPDGYEYTWSGDRYWRKNMRGGYGVDMNRNWPYYWGYDWGSSDARYSETYRGPKPLSEPETQALYNAIMSLPRRFALIDFHSFGQLILRSWGTQSTTSSNEEILSDLSQSLRSSIYRTTNTRYTPQTGNELYPTSGAMDDWAASVGFVGFTIELRDEFDFVVPSSQIVPTGEDGWAAVKALMEYAIENPGVLGPQRVVPSDGKYIMNDRPRMEVLKPKKTTKKRVRSKPTKKPQPWL